ncbi:MAG TPA: IucA/IucC family protein, partial [Pilimelia sp.]|nr:IucA/IucC family protein [Pilimelia sp.]
MSPGRATGAATRRRATGAGRLGAVAAAAREQLARAAPELVDGFAAALPRAADLVGRRLLGALCRERLGSRAAARHAAAGTRHGFDRVEFAHSPADDPAALLPAVAGRAGLAAELRDAVVWLAVAYARRDAGGPGADPLAGGLAADERVVRAERMAVEGHNLHPCGRTRLGWTVPDVLAHDLEAGHTAVGFVAVRRDLHVGDDLGAALRQAFPELPAPPPGYLLQPVHPWQRRQQRAVAGAGHRHRPPGGGDLDVQGQLQV